MDGARCNLEEISGMRLDVLRGKWSFTEDLAVNYVASFRRQPET